MCKTVLYSELTALRSGTVYRMADNLSDIEIEHKEAIVDYLVNGGEYVLGALAFAKDVFSGEDTCIPRQLISDGEYEWQLVLAYYVDKYNLMLPDDFVDHILTKKGIEH